MLLTIFSVSIGHRNRRYSYCCRNSNSQGDGVADYSLRSKESRSADSLRTCAHTFISVSPSGSADRLGPGARPWERGAHLHVMHVHVSHAYAGGMLEARFPILPLKIRYVVLVGAPDAHKAPSMRRMRFRRSTAVRSCRPRVARGSWARVDSWARWTSATRPPSRRALPAAGAPRPSAAPLRADRRPPSGSRAR